MIKPDCYGRLHDPKNTWCKGCALFLPCAIASAKAPPGDIAEIGHITRSPSERPNLFKEGSRAWAACRAANLKGGTFRESEILPLYMATCRAWGIEPGSAERNVHHAVVQMVKRGVLRRVRKSYMSHAD